SPLRSAVASVRGWQLSSWRYGRDTNRLVAEALERETWSSSDWQSWQSKRLSQILPRAASKVPHYRNWWNGKQAPADPNSCLDLANWPVLKKTVLRETPQRFLADGCDPHRMFCDHTSGTTGTPLTLWQPKSAVREWYALAEARWRGWYGLSRSDRWAILGGQLVVPVRQRKPPFWVWNVGLNQLYLSAYHLSAETCAFYLDAMRQRKVLYLLGYASSLYSLALFASERNLLAPSLKVIISNAEPLFDHQRELISRHFGCPVRDTYGMCEMVCGASECEAGRLHLWPEAGIYEVVRDDSDEPVEPGEPGRLVATGLLNPDMPLIRYEVGDRVAIAPADEQCACGRTLPILLSIEGRLDDVVVTPDGRRLGRLGPVFKPDLLVREAQIVQDLPDLVRVLVVPAPGFGPKHESALVSALRERLGNMQIQIEKVAEIPRSANGKFRAVVSKLSGRQAGSPPQAVNGVQQGR
ncbi:MAG TPA: hypothetical protein P5233_16875, partial [Candidatus Paceibacterota bacterium]|nr:hypothetical protein [Candidatus Paceibacterota bacterium]